MFIATLFIIAKRWNSNKYPSTDVWINNMSYICAMNYYAVVKKE
jgi:hypothetical protein